MEPVHEVTLSLVIPVYNVAPYIERCIKSVMKQTLDHFECILVDDASPDDSIVRCERMISDYHGNIRFRILHHTHNRGLSAARNTGTEAATGDYLLYVDSDDLISDDCVEKLMAPVQKDSTIEMVVGELMRFSDTGPFGFPSSWRQKEDIVSKESVRNLYVDAKRHFPPAAWNKLVRKDFLIQNNLLFKEGQIFEDSLWTFFVMKHLTHLFLVPDVTYFYYLRQDSISYGTDKEELAKHACSVSTIISENFTPGEEDKEAAVHVWRFCNNYVLLPRTPQLRATARRFFHALPFRRYPMEKKILIAACVLPRTAKGKEMLSNYEKHLLNRHKRK